MTGQPIRTITATAILAALTHPLASAPAGAQSDGNLLSLYGGDGTRNEARGYGDEP